MERNLFLFQIAAILISECFGYNFVSTLEEQGVIFLMTVTIFRIELLSPRFTVYPKFMFASNLTLKNCHSDLGSILELSKL